jgi:UDP-3-O-[3-hydroxymyristoyl] glucosamine N-acyltransferase
LGEETLLDSLVYIAHDVQIGRRVQVCAMASVFGRSVIGDDAYLGPSCVIKNGLMIGESARINMGSVVTENVGANIAVSGNFAIAHDRFLEHIRAIR